MTNKPDALPVVAWAFDRTAMNWTTDPVRDNLNPDKLHGLVWRDAAEAELSELRAQVTNFKQLIDLQESHYQLAIDQLAKREEEIDTLQAELAAMRADNQLGSKLLGASLAAFNPRHRLSKAIREYLNGAAPVSAPSPVAAEVVRPAVSPSFPDDSRYTYCTTQATECAGCGVRKHTPLRVDWMGGYVCLTCIDNQLDELDSAEDAEVVQVEQCQHEWTDDGQFLLVCTACGAQEDHDPHWRPIETAPRDGSMLRLLVEFSEHSTEDEDQAPTIGANNFDNDGEDVWMFAGWCWSHDHFVQGEGVPVGWLPMLEEPRALPAPSQVAAEVVQLGVTAREVILEAVKWLEVHSSGPGDSESYAAGDLRALLATSQGEA